MCYEEKRQKALEFLGTKWVLHPNYQFDPKHKQFFDTTQKQNDFNQPQRASISQWRDRRDYSADLFQ